MTLVEFLLARLDDDEAAARAATPGPWCTREADEGRAHVWGPDFTTTYAGKEYVSPSAVVVDGEDMGATSAEDAAHIARHDPGRVLAEVAAKRRIVAEYSAHVRAVGESLSRAAGAGGLGSRHCARRAP